MNPKSYFTEEPLSFVEVVVGAKNLKIVPSLIAARSLKTIMFELGSEYPGTESPSWMTQVFLDTNKHCVLNFKY